MYDTHTSERARPSARPRLASRLWPLAAIALATGCTGAIDVACTAIFVYGVNVEVIDSISGEPAATGATLELREGSYVETVTESFDGLTLSGAGERPGMYTATVTKDGYATWSRSDIVVESDLCHVIPVLATARLQPTP